MRLLIEIGADNRLLRQYHRYLHPGGWRVRVYEVSRAAGAAAEGSGQEDRVKHTRGTGLTIGSSGERSCEIPLRVIGRYTTGAACAAVDYQVQ